MLSIRCSRSGVGAALVVALACSSGLRAADETGKSTVPADAPPLKLPSLSPSAEPETTLSVGKPAPPFVVGSWVKGEPLENLKPGQVYVVEFWATWCGPCLAGMPHISQLQTDYGDKVRIIGISREEESVVREFLTKDREEGVTWDQTVTYSLAMDADNAMNTTWFRAAGRTGIPSAFLVGKDGVIDWIGHPARIDEPLAKVIDGTWDRQAAIAEYEVELKKMKAAAEARKVQMALSKAVVAKDWDQALVIVEELIKADPDSPVPRLSKLSILGQSGKTEEATALMNEMVKADWDKGVLLANLANGIAMAKLPGSLDEAERLAKRAVELTNEKGISQLHALARVYAEQGKLDDAITWERKALDLAENNVMILRTLREYEDRKEKQDAPAESGPK
jgi:thiol-disulfide isomerase/thioredoxin